MNTLGPCREAFSLSTQRYARWFKACVATTRSTSLHTPSVLVEVELRGSDVVNNCEVQKIDFRDRKVREVDNTDSTITRVESHVWCKESFIFLFHDMTLTFTYQQSGPSQEVPSTDMKNA